MTVMPRIFKGDITRWIVALVGVFTLGGSISGFVVREIQFRSDVAAALPLVKADVQRNDAQDARIAVMAEQVQRLTKVQCATLKVIAHDHNIFMPADCGIEAENK